MSGIFGPGLWSFKTVLMQGAVVGSACTMFAAMPMRKRAKDTSKIRVTPAEIILIFFFLSKIFLNGARFFCFYTTSWPVFNAKNNTESRIWSGFRQDRATPVQFIFAYNLMNIIQLPGFLQVFLEKKVIKNGFLWGGTVPFQFE